MIRLVLGPSPNTNRGEPYTMSKRKNQNSYKSMYETNLFKNYSKLLVKHFSNDAGKPYSIYTYSGVQDKYSDNKRTQKNGFASFRVVDNLSTDPQPKNYLLLGNIFESTHTSIDGTIKTEKNVTFLKSWLDIMATSRNRDNIPDIIICKTDTENVMSVIQVDGKRLLSAYKDGEIKITINDLSEKVSSVIINLPIDKFIIKKTECDQKMYDKILNNDQLAMDINIRRSFISKFVIGTNRITNFWAYMYDKATGVLLQRYEVDDVTQFENNFDVPRITIIRRLKDGKLFKATMKSNKREVYIKLSREAKSSLEERADIIPDATPIIVKQLRDTGKTFSEVAKILHRRKADVIALYKKYFADLEAAQTAVLLQMTAEEEKPQVEEAAKTRIKMRNDEIDEDAEAETEDWTARIRKINSNNFKRR